MTEPTGEGGAERWLPAGHFDPDFTQATEFELSRLAALPANWDSYGAPPIDRAIIAAAGKLVPVLSECSAYRPRVVPMSTGNLQLEWHHGSKILELEFETPDTIRFLQWQPEVGIEEEDTFKATDTDKAVELIQWFMLGTLV